MRSEKNPYFLLRKSKNPQIQEWLKKAETMSIEEITTLKIKPDLQRAMLYIQQQKHDAISQNIAMMLADQMQENNPIIDRVYSLWTYNGPSTFFITQNESQVNIENGDPWLKDSDRAYVNSTWGCISANQFLVNSSSIGNGTFSDLPRLKREAIMKRHPMLQISDSLTTIRYA